MKRIIRYLAKISDIEKEIYLHGIKDAGAAINDFGYWLKGRDANIMHLIGMRLIKNQHLGDKFNLRDEFDKLT